MATWEDCKNYGLIEIQSNGTLRLHYSKNSYLISTRPLGMGVVESAMWQGNNVIVSGKNDYGEPAIYMLKDFNSGEYIKFW